MPERSRVRPDRRFREAVGDVMKSRRNFFGRSCFFVGLAVLYALVGMKVHIAWRDGLWPVWRLGDTVPDAVVRAVFSLEAAPVRSALVWLLSRDVVGVVAAICLIVLVLDLFANIGGSPGDHEDALSR